MRKRVIAVLCAAVMVLGAATTAFAAPSPAVPGVVTGTSEVVDADGNVVEGLEIKDVPEEYKEVVEEIKDIEKIKELLGDEFEEGMQVVDVKDVTVPEGTKFPVTITFTVTGVTKGSKVKVLHYDTDKKEWEVIEAIAGDGTITATFESLSPVAFVVDKKAVEANQSSAGTTNIDTSGSSGASATSPKTGETPVGTYAGIIAVFAAIGMGIAYYKKRKAE